MCLLYCCTVMDSPSSTTHTTFHGMPLFLPVENRGLPTFSEFERKQRLHLQRQAQSFCAQRSRIPKSVQWYAGSAVQACHLPQSWFRTPEGRLRPLIEASPCESRVRHTATSPLNANALHLLDLPGPLDAKCIGTQTQQDDTFLVPHWVQQELCTAPSVSIELMLKTGTPPMAPTPMYWMHNGSLSAQPSVAGFFGAGQLEAVILYLVSRNVKVSVSRGDSYDSL